VLKIASSKVNRRNLKEIVTQLITHLIPKETRSSSKTAAASLLIQTAEGSSSGVNSGNQAATMSPAYRFELVQRILQMTSVNTYENVSDFEWYLSVLVDLAYIAKAPVGMTLRNSLLDVVSRVKNLRRYAVQLCSRMLNDDHFKGNSADGCTEVIYAAAWICGEYSR